jgi:RNA polymerase sigma factor (sigma-70 family)
MTTNPLIPLSDKFAQSFVQSLPTQGSALQDALDTLALAPADKRTINKAYAAIKAAVVRQLASSAGYDTAQSIAQDVALRIFQHAADGRQLTVALVRTTARNLATNAALRAGMVKRDSSRDTKESVVSWAKPPEHVELLEKLAQLPRNLSDVLALRFLDDLTVREVADKIGVSPATVVRLQKRGLEQMRELLVA